MKMHVGMMAIPPIWWWLNQFQHLHNVEFDVSFTFFLNIYEITWKLGWNTSYLVATIWVLFPILLNLASNSAFCWIYANYMKRWLKYVLFGGHQICFGLPSRLELSPKLIKYVFFLLYLGLYHLYIMHPCLK
jgi:hypothetical protein